MRTDLSPMLYNSFEKSEYNLSILQNLSNWYCVSEKFFFHNFGIFLIRLALCYYNNFDTINYTFSSVPKGLINTN